jgi:hypothetical protein
LPRAPAKPRTLESSDVFVTFVCLYVLSATGNGPFSDSYPMWQAAENLVRHGTLAIDVRWPVNAPVGRGGQYYPVAALLAVLIHVPGALVHTALAAINPARAASFVVMTSQLGPIFAGALTPALLFGLLRRLGYERRPAAWTALLAGGATSIYVYARCPYSEIVQTACFTWFLSSLLGAGESLDRRAFLRLGFAFGLLLNTKNVYAVCLPGALVFLWTRHRARPRQLGLALGWAALGGLPGFAALAVYNAVRWGSPFTSGYEAVTGGFWSHNVLWGLWGQLLSPGKSVFLYSPALIVALFGVRKLVARRPSVALAIALTVGPIVLLYAHYQFWSGDWAWGPRYLVFALPALTIPIAELLADGGPTSRLRRLLLPAALLAGIGVQVLGCLVRWDDYMMVAGQAQHAWLGTPDRRGTVLDPYPCFSCFEEVYGAQWLPPMQPIAGHLWLLRHRIAGDDWKTAQADAAWRRYTSLTLDIEESYNARTVDWWLMAAPPDRRAVAALVIFGLLGAAVPYRAWRSALLPALNEKG